ncbi:ABC transporter ATP-binding protein [Marivita sp. GX14005]|uniref:ABC transporter ATP-binding protein n=1 Tax=Marivita sp. GX14005 TaxID=2942276 RepID=UPI0020199B43|nr:ABC transporter ATP-binding protein [Marivita sp. GX14005]MCL3883899.1 ABC transporter ATP-binding protein/permease [Marivita sp. GX14005]
MALSDLLPKPVSRTGAERPEKPEKPEKRPMFSEIDRGNIVWFWNRYLKSKTPWLFLVLGMIAIQGFVYQQFLALTEDGLRVIFESGATRDLVKVCGIVFALFTTRALMSYLIPRLSVWLASDAVMKMRRDLIDHLMTLDLAFFERTQSGEIILRLVNQSQGLSQFVGQATVNAVRDAATILIVSGYLIYKSPLLFTAALIVLPMILLLLQHVSSTIKNIQATAENALGAYMTGIDEMTSGMRTVKIAGQEPVERARLVTATEGIRSISIRLQAAQALVMPAIDMMAAFVYVLVIGGGGYMVLSGDFGLDGAGIIAYLLGLALIFDPARMLAGFFAKLQANLILLDGIRSLYREIPRITNAPDAHEEFDRSGDLALEDVRFSYDPQHPLFDGLSMRFPGGRITAIVGATGSGKTTVLSLLTRLYDVEEGRVSIGGTPIDRLKIKALRSSFSVVAQDIVIFNSSLKDNIRYVRPDATDEEVRAAAEAAEIADLMDARGDAPLGPKGSQLSGGQKQRIAIARAFLRGSPILLLDEATSALDQKTEDKVKRALNRLSEGRTTLIVAHRLSAIAHADWIYVMDVGKVVEQGTHADLLAQDGLYAGMYGAQKQSYG